jgi:c(7)-type cytochrome triheme protein
MKKIAILPAALTALAALMLAAPPHSFTQTDPPKGPIKLTFTAKPGDVTYYHFAHAKRLNGNCSACHPKLFQQNTAAPLKFAGDSHRPAVKQQTSCGACHRTGGSGFSVENNCQKRCHTPAAS